MTSALSKSLAVIRRLEQDLASARSEKNEPIAIVGMGCRFPGGANDPEAFWRLLERGAETRRMIPADRWQAGAYAHPPFGHFLDLPLDGFDDQVFRVTPEEIRNLDPQQRLLLEVTWEALEDAAIAPASVAGSRTGVFVGIEKSDYSRAHLYSGDVDRITAYSATGISSSTAAGRISYLFDFHGPCVSMDAACASSLVSLDHACQSLRRGTADMAVAAAVSLMLAPEPYVALTRLSALSPDGRSKSFDASADGYGRGEGCAALVLKRLSDAQRDGDRILALVRSVAVHHGGRSNGLTAPNLPSQVRVIREALAEAGVAPAEVSYLEAHGTGTALGDPIEMGAIAQVFGGSRTKEQPLLVGSVKTNVGHLETAAGMAGVIKVVLSLRHGKLPPHLHFSQPSPHIPWETLPVAIPTSLTDWNGPRVAGVNSFGFSGTVAHAVISEPPPMTDRANHPDRPLHLLALSAHEEPALRALAAAYAEHDSREIADVCFSANTGRNHFQHRAAMLVEPGTSLRGLELRPRLARSGDAVRVAFLFTGQGAQYQGMGRTLYESQPVFRDAMDRCTSLLSEPDAQTELFALEYALCELWHSWGVRPSVVLGHSLGEYAAACVAGVFSLEDGLRLVAARARLVRQYARPGRMASLPAEPRVVEEAIARYGGRVAVAACNGPQATAISGEASAVEELVARFAGRLLDVPHAFHSRLMEPVIEPLRQVLQDVSFSEPRIPLISNATGKAAEPGQLTNPEYWLRHLREPVLFEPCIETLEALGYELALEVGPKPVLCALGQQCAPSGRIQFLPSLTPRVDAWRSMLTSLGELYTHGVDIDWRGFDKPYARRKTATPTYRFQRRSFWMEGFGARGVGVEAVREAFAEVEALGRVLLAQAFEQMGDSPAVLPEYQRLMAWLQELRREPVGPARDAGDIVRRYPDMAGAVKLLTTCLDAYPDVLRGKRKAVEVLFPGGSMSLLEDVYGSGRIAEYFNRQAARAVRELVSARQGLVEIVEIGAGTGGVSKVILEALAEFRDRITYYYTDVSAGFTREAQGRLAQRYPFVRFGVLDIEKDIAAQGLAVGRFQIAVASNVLHATRHMGRTLQQAARLLCPGGALILNEVTQLHEFIGLTFGLTPGWWLYEDPEIRTRHSPVLSAGSWRKALEAQGFTMTKTYTLAGDDPSNPVQAVMVAERRGAAEPAGSGTRAVLADLIARIAGITIADRDYAVNLFELGLDSLVLMQIKQAIDQKFGVEISMGQFYEELSTLDRLAAHLGSRTDVAPAAPVMNGSAAAVGANGPVGGKGVESTGGTAVERLVERQLEIMAEQLALLKAQHAGAPAPSRQDPRRPVEKSRSAAAPSPAIQHAPVRLAPEQQRLLDRLIERYNRRTRKSKEYAAQARPYLADWIGSIGFRAELKEMIYPIVSSRSDGSHVWDLDGNEYVDIAMGFGVGFFGHRPPFLVEALHAQIDDGFELATQSDLVAEAARLLCELTGCERVAFSNTGTEAVMTAFRLARTVTGKSKIAYFSGSFHGSYDGVLAYHSADGPAPVAPGILASQVEDVVVLEYGAEESLRVIEERAHELAGVLVEPVQSRNPDLQPREFLQRLRNITARHGVALIFDEMITGFRVHPGGAQAWFGVEADLVTYGKMFGGGMPVSAIAGKAAFLDPLDGGQWRYGDDSRPTATMTFFGGTYCKHPLAMVSAVACLRHMKAQGPELQAGLNRRTAEFCERLNGLFAEEQVPLRAAWFSSQFQFRMGTRGGETFQSLELSILFFLMLEKGIFTWERRICFLSVAHTAADLDRIVTAVRDSVREMKRAGFFGATPEPEPETVPMTQGQKELWFLAQESGAASTAYSEPVVLELNGRLDRVALGRALNQVVRRHQALRTTKVDGECLHIAPALEVEIPIIPAADLAQQCRLGFDLSRGPLLRAALIEAGPERHLLVLAAHHIIADGWSMGVLIQELAQIYSRGEESLPPAAPFADYVRWLGQRSGDKDAEFWRERLAGPLRNLELPVDFRRGARHGSEGRRLRLTMDGPGVKAFCKEHRCSPFMLLLATFQVMLQRLARQDDILVGIPSSGHAAMGVERMIGQASGMLPLATTVSPDLPFADLLRGLAQDLLRVYEHQAGRPELPGDVRLRAAFNQDRVPGGREFAGLETRLLPSDVGFVKYDLSLNAIELDGQWLLDFDYNSELFRAETVEGWARAYVELLTAAMLHPARAVGELAAGLFHAAPPGREVWIGANRICLDELEEVLKSHSGVVQVRAEAGDGAVVAQVEARGCSADLLRRHLGLRTPVKFWINGVEDLAARDESPRDATQALVLEIFRDVLKLPAAGLDDDFFDLGGHSIQATLIVSRIATACDVALSLSDVLKLRTAAALAAKIAGSESLRLPPIPALSAGEFYEASHAQRRLWVLAQIEEQSLAYNLPGAYAFDGFVRVEAARRAFQRLVDRHESLRTTFVNRDGRLQQRVHRTMQVALEEEVVEAEGAIQQRIEDEARTPFNLEKGPLFRVRLLRLPERHVLLYNFHHIVCDGWSQVVMLRELAREGQGLPRIQYRDYAAWQQPAERSRRFWTEQLSDEIGPLDLPTDFTRPAVQTMAGRCLRFGLGAGLTADLKRRASAQGCTLFMAAVALVKVLLHRYCGAEDILVGTPVAGRSHPDLEDQIGYYVNTLVLRDRISGEWGFRETLERVSRTVLEAFDHQDYPFDLLVEDLGVRRDLSRSPLFDVFVTMQNNENAELVLDGMTARPVESDFAVSAFDLSFDFCEEGSELRVMVKYNTGLFRASRMERMAGHFVKLAAAAVEEPERATRDLNILLDGERAALAAINQTAAEFRGPSTVTELFERQAMRTPDRTAVVYGESQLTYRRLNELANRLAARLALKPDETAAMLLPRSEWCAVGILGILKAGGAWVPLDPEQPEQRLRELIRAAGCKAMVTSREFMELARRVADVAVTDVEAPAGGAAQTPRIQAHHLAYVLFTSGTTGTPKGVMVEHRSIVNLMGWLEREVYARLGGAVREAMLPSFVFDVTVQQLLGSLLHGHTLYIVDEETRRDPVRLGEYLRRHEIQLVNFTPTLLAHALSGGMRSEGWALGELLIGAEPLPRQLVDRFYADPARRVIRMRNLYGPTECCVDATSCEVPLDGGAPITAGRPIANTRIYICDERMRLVPWGVIGEVCIGGAGVARGYLGDEAATRARFVDAPFDADGRVYRTGDLGRWTEDGLLELAGRNDEQVKIRGVRMDPVEIENRLLALGGVREAAVVARRVKDQEPDLVAYVVGESAPTAAALREQLRRVLPEAMIPTLFVTLQALPRTTGGKLNKRALPAPEEGRAEPGQAPRNPLESKLLEIWREVLPVESIGLDDSFFELGGNSLRAVQVAARVKETFGCELRLRDLFTHASIASLAALVAEAAGIPLMAPTPTPMAAHYPVSPGQQRLWLLHQTPEARSAYNMAAAFLLEGPLDAAALRRSLEVLSARHETLRTSIEAVDGEPRQFVAASIALPFAFTDLSAAAEPETEARRLAQEEAARPFDLETAPLWRARLLKLRSEGHVFLFNMHHAIADGWSVGVLARELSEIYETRSPDVSPHPIQYRDYTAWQEEYLRSPRAQEDRRYWMENLAGELPRLELPADRPRPAIQTYRGETLRFALPTDVAAGLEEIAQSSGITVFPVMVALVKALLFRYTGEPDIIIGTAVAGREQRAFESQIGFYVNTVPLRDRVEAGLAFRELAKRAAATVTGAMDHGAYPFDRLVDDLGAGRDPAHMPLFDVMVVLDDGAEDGPRFDGVKVSRFADLAPASHFDLVVYFHRRADGWGVELEYNPDLYDGWRFTQLFGHLETLARSVAADAERTVGDCEILRREERHLVVHAFNETRTHYPRESSIVDLFREQVKLRPAAQALVHGARSLTYGELDQLSDEWAAGLDLKAEELVGVMAERSADTIAAFLAILKAGGAYVPIDPGYPEARIEAMRRDVGRMFAGRMSEVTAGRHRADGIASGRLAYVLYTSGSTGQPKGVQVEHRAVARLVKNTNFISLDASHRILQTGALSFDASTFEIWGALLNGGCLVLAERHELLDVHAMGRLIRDHGITTMWLTSSLFDQFVELDHHAFQPLRHLLVGGERLSPPHVEKVRAAFPALRMYNGYGPTENTTFSAVYPIEAWAGTLDIPIGRPIANSRIYVLDACDEPAPVGIPGEICAAGDGLARGYLGNDQLTRERFVEHRGLGERIYRTGDYGYWLPDGNLAYLGRKDRQIKVRGHRVELGEIEAALMGHAGVRNCAVDVHEGSAGAELVAYVVGEPGLRIQLSGRLPDHMLPSHVVMLDRLPLDPNGKLDRAALPEPRRETAAGRAPSNEVETRLVEIWESLLGRRISGVDDDFFELGGHSLMAVRLLNRVREEFGIAIDIRDVLAAPSVARLASRVISAMLAGRRSQGNRIPTLPAAEHYAVSPSQRSLWLLDQLEDGRKAYLIRAAFEIEGDLDAGALEQAFSILAARHESLRTTFVAVNGEPRQRVSQTIACRGDGEFNLAKGPLFQVKLEALNNGRHGLELTLHHIIADGWSMLVLQRELAQVYQALRRGETPVLPPLALQYRDYAAWQTDRKLEAHGKYWREKLANAPVLEVATDFARPARKTYRGGTVTATLDERVARRLREVGRARGASLFSVLVALTKVLLHRYSGQEDILTGTPVAGRNHPDLEDQVGFYAGTVVLRDAVHAAEPFAELLARVQQTVAEALQHQDYPFDRLVEELGVARDPGRSPVFDVMVAFEEPAPATTLDGVTLRPVACDLEIAKYDLMFVFRDLGAAIDVAIEYSSDLFERARVERMQTHLAAVAREVGAMPEKPVGALELLGESERRRILEELAYPRAPFVLDRTVVELFEAQTATTPEAAAVVGNHRKLTYGELSEAANGVAWELATRFQVKPDDRVGLAVDRSELLLVGLLGILKAGAAYVPVDVRDPAKRVQAVLADSECRALVADGAGEALGFWGFDGRVVMLTDADRRSSQAPATTVKPHNLAYLIFTSGSTGRPKAVMVEHRPVLNLTCGIWQEVYSRYEGPLDVALVASHVFDASGQQIYPALLAGHRLHVVDDDTRRDGRMLLRFFQQRRIQISDCTPTLLAMLVEAGLCETPGLALRHLIVGGEALSAELVARIRASRHLDGVAITNVYGPTECVIDCTLHHVSESDVTRRPVVTIGRPFPNVEAFVLDAERRPAPIGVPGEMYFGGECLARCYFGDESLTRERFVAHPLRAGERVYRTGDYGRWLEDGTLEFLGRQDHQVKIRGHRVEPGEIELALGQCEGVRQAKVLADDGALTAYLVAAEVPDGARLRRELEKRLPNYMIPSRFVVVDEIPLTPSGKIDRRALRAIGGTAVELSRPFEAPRGETEITIAQIWQEVLGARAVGRDDGFFEVGGHSLAAARILSRMQTRLGVEIRLRDLFDHPTVAGLARLAALGEQAPVEALQPTGKRADYSLSHAQRRLWVLDQIHEGSLGYSMPSAYELDGPLDVARLRGAFQELVDRHESLRTVFVKVEGEPRQKIQEGVFVAFAVETAEDVEAAVRLEAGRPFDLEHGPLLRVRLLRMEPERHVLLFNMHHIVGDGASLEILVRELTALYEGRALAAPRLQYRDCVAAVRRDEGDRAYWLERMAAPPVLGMPTDFPRPAVMRQEGSSLGCSLNAAPLRVLAQKFDCSPFMVALALVHGLLHRYTGDGDIVIGIPVSGRYHPDVLDVVGLFAETRPIRNRLACNETFSTLLRRVRETVIGALDHDGYPFDLLVDELQLDRDLSRSPLFDVMVAWQDSDPARFLPEGLPARPVEFPVQGSQFDLTFSFVEGPEKIALSIVYRTDLFRPERIARMAAHVASIAEAVTAQPDVVVAELDLAQSSATANAEDFPTIVEVFEEKAARNPGKIALTCEGRSLSFGELNARANGLAAYLRREYGAGPDDRVAIEMPRSEWVVIAILGVLKAGAAYVPIDPGYPAERKEYIAGDSGSVTVLTAEVVREAAIAAENPARVAGPQNLAYVMYTSGSTGKPKGVMVEHAGVTAFARNLPGVFGLEESDVFYALTTITFDISVLEILCPLMQGMRVILAGEDADVLREIAETGATAFQTTPSRMTMLAQQGSLRDLVGLRVLILGGERLTQIPDVACTIYNAYGPTETTIWSAVARIGKGPITIGKPLLGELVVILSPAGRLQPVGIPGEICIGGIGLARGYLNRPDLTAQQFVADPFRPGERLYRTGDFGRWTEHGEIEFLGRQDRQVKIRGHRIELGEIEEALKAHPQVRRAAAAAPEIDGCRELVAYFEGEVNPEELRQSLGERLPGYMVPSFLVAMQEWPLTANGKLNLKALPDPCRTPAVQASEAPASETERQLLAVWADVLGRNGFGVTDNFFELGGHSLKAARIAAKVHRELGVDLRLRDLFARPTVRELADLVEGMQPGGRAIERIPDAATYAVSPGQRRIWVLSELERDSRVYHMPVEHTLEGSLDWDALERSFQALIARHESLRTVFVTEASGELRQKVMDAVEFRLGREQETARFDLECGPLLRASVVEIAEGRYRLAFDMHHIISDGWSLGVLVEELNTLYRRGELPPLALQYRDFAAWQNRWLASPEVEADGRYWLEKLSGDLPVLDLPADFPRPKAQSFAGATLQFELEPELVEALERLARKQDVSLFMVLLAAFQSLLYRYTGAEDLVIGTAIAGREQAGLENQIGLFLNTLALRTRLLGEKGFEAAIGRVRQTVTEAFEHQAYPFDVLVDRLQVVRDLSRSPVFDVFLVMQNLEPASLELPGVKAIPVESASQVSKFDLSLVFHQDGGRLAATIEYSTALFRADRIERLWAHLSMLIAGALADPQRPLCRLPLEAAAEFVEQRVARETTIIERFEEQVAKTPDRIAVTCGDRALTYRQLNGLANGVAALLHREHQVRPDDRIALELERSEWMVVGLFGVLKAGAAYVPIDPAYPSERKAFLSADSGSRTTLRDAEIRAAAPVFENLPLAAGPANLAYVLYTSGSTGQPKGVMIEHRNVTAFCENLRTTFGMTADDVVYALTTYTFDISVLELICPLLEGMRVAVGDGDDIEASGATVLQVTPSRLELLLGYGHLPPVRILLVGGEALSPDLHEVLRRLPVRAFNVYGPTETTIWSTAVELGAGELTIGQPLPGEWVWILSAAGELQPVGIPGEIAIGGTGLGRGYLNRPDLTAERYTAHPFRVGERLYRTGDVGRRRADGNIEFLGRVDQQVKIRGFRIELGEIESVLAEHPDVRRAAVLVREVGGSRELVAYVSGCDEAEVRRYVEGRLPRYMVPSYIVTLDTMPLMPSGKIDRKGLPAPGVTPRREVEPPKDEWEARLLEIWESVLARRGIGVTDDFLSVGGHSLRAAQVANRIRQDMGAGLSLRDLFEFPTVRQLASRTRDQRRVHQAPVLPAAPAPDYPLSHAQRSLWIQDRMYHGSTAYNISGSFVFEGWLDADRLERAFQDVIRRHESLRTSFHVVNGEPRQVVHEAVLFRIERGGPAELRPEVFDLGRAPLMRARLVSLAERRHALYFELHHIIADGWSLDILVRELEAAYQGDELPAPPLQYKDYAVWEERLERDGAWQRSREFWVAQLSGQFPVLELPADRPRPPVKTHRGGTVSFAVNSEVAARMAALNRQHGATTFMSLLTAAAILLHRVTGSRDMIVGSVSNGRDQAEWEHQIGCFVNVIPLRMRVDARDRFSQVLEGVRQVCLAAFPHRNYPFDRLVQDLRVETAPGRSPLFDVAFSWNGMEHVGRRHFAGLSLAGLGDEIPSAKYDLLIAAGESGGQLSGVMEYNTDLFDRSTIEELARQFLLVLEQAVSGDDPSVMDLRLHRTHAMGAASVVEIDLNL